SREGRGDHDHDRAVPRDRAEGRDDPRRRAASERRPAARAACRPGRWRGAPAGGRHPRALPARGAGRAPGGGGREPRAREATRRREPGHGAGRLRRRARGPPPARRRGRPGSGRPLVSDPPIHAEGLVRAFAGTPVLAGVDLVVRGGEAVVLLGPNGAGKTTLLRILALLLRPGAGRLALFGTDAGAAPPALRRRIGYVGHESLCYPDLTAAENLAFYARLFDVPDAAARIAELIGWAGLEAAARRPVRAYSRGMAQRLALARALLHGPDLLLLDEPFAGLDPEAVAALQHRLGVLLLVVLTVAHDPTPEAAPALAPAVLWVSFVFTGLAGIQRGFLLERENDCLAGLLTAPVDPADIYAGKLAVNVILLAVTQG